MPIAFRCFPLLFHEPKRGAINLSLYFRIYSHLGCLRARLFAREHVCVCVRGLVCVRFEGFESKDKDLEAALKESKRCVRVHARRSLFAVVFVYDCYKFFEIFSCLLCVGCLSPATKHDKGTPFLPFML